MEISIHNFFSIHEVFLFSCLTIFHVALWTAHPATAVPSVGRTREGCSSLASGQWEGSCYSSPAGWLDEACRPLERDRSSTTWVDESADPREARETERSGGTEQGNFFAIYLVEISEIFLENDKLKKITFFFNWDNWQHMRVKLASNRITIADFHFSWTQRV